MENNRKRKYNENKKNQKLAKLAKEFSESIKEKSVDSSSQENESTESESVLCSNHNENKDSYEPSDELIQSSENSALEEDSNDDDGEIHTSVDLLECTDIKAIQAWVVDNNIPHIHVNKLLKILKRRLLLDIPTCTKTLLKCDVNLDNLENMKLSDGSMGEFIHLGIKMQLEKSVEIKVHSNNLLELIFNIDGFSPFKSSPVSIWPILCKVYTEMDLYQPFTVAVYAGNGKPASSEDYLTKFVVELNEVLKSGVHIQSRHFSVKIKYFVCDCPARSFLKCVVGHMAFKGCERCNVIGKKIDRVTVFFKLTQKRKQMKASKHLNMMTIIQMHPY